MADRSYSGIDSAALDPASSSTRSYGGTAETDALGIDRAATAVPAVQSGPLNPVGKSADELAAEHRYTEAEAAAAAERANGPVRAVALKDFTAADGSTHKAGDAIDEFAGADAREQAAKGNVHIIVDEEKVKVRVIYGYLRIDGPTVPGSVIEVTEREAREEHYANRVQYVGSDVALVSKEDAQSQLDEQNQKARDDLASGRIVGDPGVNRPAPVVQAAPEFPKKGEMFPTSNRPAGGS